VLIGLLLLATTPAHAPGGAEIVCATDHWLLFVRSDVIPSQLHVQNQRLRYWLQRVGESKARLVFDATLRHPPTVAAVLDDGTIALHNRATELYWLPLGAKPADKLPAPVSIVDRKGVRHRIRQVYADGLVLQPSVAQAVQPVFWVPLKNGRPRWDARLRVSKNAVASLSTPPFLRHQDRFAFGPWIGTLKGGLTRTLKVVNWIRVYDTTYAVDFKKIIRVADGKEIPLPYMHQIFALRDGFAYGLRVDSGPGPSRVFSVDLETGKLSTMLEWKSPRISSAMFRPNPRNVISTHHPKNPVQIFWNKEGVFVWKDPAWQLLAWRSK